MYHPVAVGPLAETRGRIGSALQGALMVTLLAALGIGLVFSWPHRGSPTANAGTGEALAVQRQVPAVIVSVQPPVVVLLVSSEEEARALRELLQAGSFVYGSNAETPPFEVEVIPADANATSLASQDIHLSGVCATMDCPRLLHVDLRGVRTAK